MRKVLFLVTLLLSFSAVLKAVPTYFPITHTFGPAVINGQTVTVTPLGPNPATPSFYCGVGPYYIGTVAPSGFRYQFSGGATHVRIRMTDIHLRDSVRFTINGAPYTLVTSDVTAFGGTCGAPGTYVIAPDGRLTSAVFIGIGAGAEIILQIPPALMTDVRVQQLTPPAQGADGVVYSIEFAKDSCEQKLTVTNNAPCATRKLILNATAFPGATFDWTGPVGFNIPNGGPTVTREPVLINMGGFYVATVHWGTCVFKDSTQVDMITKATPAPPTISVKSGNNPGCKNSDLILTQVSTGASGIQYYWYGPNIPITTPVTTQDLSLLNIQPSDQGTYYAFAVSTTTCSSDTVPYTVSLLPDVTANMTIDISRYGCVQDTIIIQNLSTGNNVGYLYMNPVHGNIASPNQLVDATNNPSIIIYHPNVARDTLPDTFDMKFVATNGTCYDSITQRIVINHPLRADFIVSDDTICQGTAINFSNKSSAAAGPTHQYLWDYKTGYTDATYDATYTYVNSGVYEATLVVTDYLKCKDSAKHLIFVDSTGAISFTADPDTTICAGKVIDFKGIYEPIGTLSTSYVFGDGDSVVNTAVAKHAYERAGTYTVKFTSYNRVCKDTFSTRDMIIKPYPLVDLGPDTTICPNGQPVVITERLHATDPNAKFSWNTETKDKTPGITVRYPGVYAATVEVDGCATTDSVQVLKNCYVNIPNSFTPDEDGTNDYFLPRQLLSKGVKAFKMDIFNRWGQLIFETNSIDGRGWDGKFNGEAQPTGVYVYLIDVTFTNGTSEHYTGNVTLLR